MTHRLLCIDPGKGTGVVWMSYRDTSAPWIERGENLELDPHEMYMQVCEWAHTTWHQMDAYDRRLVICESWIPYDTDFSADPNYSCQLIGAVKVACTQNQVELRMQPPSYRNSIKAEVYRRSPYWLTGTADHHRQAARHGLAYLQEELKHTPTMTALHPRKR